MPPHKNQVNFDTNAKTKSFSTLIQKPSQLWSLHWNQVKFDSPHWNQVNFDHPHISKVKFDAHTKTKWFSACIQKTRQFRPPTPKPSQSISTLKTSHFRPTQKKQVNRDYRTKTKSILINTKKPNDYRPEHIKNNIDPPHIKVNFDTHTKTKSVSIHHEKKLIFRPYHWNQVIFDPHSSIKSILMPRHKIRFRFDPDTKNK